MFKKIKETIDSFKRYKLHRNIHGRIRGISNIIFDYPMIRHWSKCNVNLGGLEKKIKLDYDNDADVLYISFGDPEPCKSDDSTDLVIRHGRLNGITIIDFNKKVAYFEQESWFDNGYFDNVCLIDEGGKIMEYCIKCGQKLEDTEFICKVIKRKVLKLEIKEEPC